MAPTHDECELSSEEEEILPDIYSSSEENLEGELDALGYTCEPEYSKEELIRLGIIDVINESQETDEEEEMKWTSWTQVDLRTYTGVLAHIVV